MRKSLFFIVPICMLALAVAGCNSFNRVLRSSDRELKYRTGMELFNAGKYRQAVELLSSVQPAFLGSDREDSIAFFIGLSYYRQSDFESSGLMFDDFRKTHGRSHFLQDAEYMYAMGLFYQSPPPNRDQIYTVRAIVAMNEYLERYPNSERSGNMRLALEDLWDKLKEKSFINAKVYYDIREYKAAVVAFRNSLDQYPDTRHREEIMYLIVRSNWLLARNSFASLQRERFMNVLSSYYNFVGEFPESAYLPEVQRMQEDARTFLSRFTDMTNTNTNTTDTQHGN